MAKAKRVRKLQDFERSSDDEQASKIFKSSDAIFKNSVVQTIVKQELQPKNFKSVTFHTRASNYKKKQRIEEYEVCNIAEPIATKLELEESEQCQVATVKDELKNASQFLKMMKGSWCCIGSGWNCLEGLSLAVIGGFRSNMTNCSGRDALDKIAHAALDCIGINQYVYVRNIGRTHCNDENTLPLKVETVDCSDNKSTNNPDLPPDYENPASTSDASPDHRNTSSSSSSPGSEKQKTTSVVPDIIVKEELTEGVHFYMCIEIKSSFLGNFNDSHQLLLKCIAAMPHQNEVYGLLVCRDGAELYHLIKDYDTENLTINKVKHYTFPGDLADMFEGMVVAFKAMSKIAETRGPLFRGHNLVSVTHHT